MLLIKSEKPKRKLTKKIDDIFSFIKYPEKIIGKEKKVTKKEVLNLNQEV